MSWDMKDNPMKKTLLLSLLGLLLLGATSLTGCQKALFPENSDRTQYDRYMVLRGQTRPVNEENAYGGKQPALYARLKPLNQP
jgi:hypothetical protein